MQHEFADSHQRPSTSRVTLVEMAPTLPERGRERQLGRTASQTVQNLRWEDRGIQSLWECRWFGRIWTTINRMATICSGSRAIGSVCENRENVDFDVWWLRMATSGGNEWRLILKSGGGERRRWLAQGALTRKALLEWPVVMSLLRVSALLV